MHENVGKYKISVESGDDSDQELLQEENENRTNPIA